jgi:hypothetical protein
MMRKLILAALILIPVIAFAQGVPDLKDKSYVGKDSCSLFDPSRLTMRQSYSLGYYSGGGRSGSIGYYLNSIEYVFSNPLRIRVDLGYLHSPTSMFSGGSSTLNSGVFVPGLAVDWRPSRNILFRLDYRHVPLGVYGRRTPYYYDTLDQEDNR